MKVDIQEISPVERKLSVEISPDRIDQEIEKALQDAARTHQFKGFRKGKAPLKLVERYVKREALLPGVIDDLVPEVYREVLEEKALIPLSRPQVELGEVKLGQPVTFSAAFEVAPDFELPDPTGIQVEARRLKVEDAQVDEELQRLREAHSRLVGVEEDRPLAAGDEARVDFESFVDGKPVERGSAKDFVMTVAAENFVPGFVEQVVGMKRGQERAFTVTFPESYGSELAGKDVDFRFKLLELQQRVVPEADDNLAREVGKFETIEELKKHLREHMNTQAQSGARSEAGRKVWDAFAGQVEIPLPTALVNKWLGVLLGEFARQLGRMGRTLEQYLESSGKSFDAIKDEFTPRARLMAKEEIVFQAVAQHEKLEVTEAEILAEISAYAARMGKSPGQVRVEMEEKGTLSQLHDQLMQKKVVDFLVEKATVNWREVTPEEFRAEEEAAEKAELEAREAEAE